MFRRRETEDDDTERQVRRKIAVCDDYTSVVEPSIKPKSLDIIVHPEAKKHELLNNYKDAMQNMVISNLTRQNTLRSLPVLPYREHRDDDDDDETQVCYDYFLFFCFLIYYVLLLVFIILYLKMQFTSIEWLE